MPGTWKETLGLKNKGASSWSASLEEEAASFHQKKPRLIQVIPSYEPACPDSLDLVGKVHILHFIFMSPYSLFGEIFMGPGRSFFSRQQEKG